MAPDPANPYTPSAALADEEARRLTRRPSRLLGVAATVLGHPFPGAGQYVLGRLKPFVALTIAGGAAYGLMVAGVFARRPMLSLSGTAALVVLMLAAIAATLIARPGAAPPSFRRALVVAALIFVAGRATTFATNRLLILMVENPSGSMLPTLEQGDRMMVRRGHGHIHRGDVVVFDLPSDRRLMYIKRVVAVAGDTFRMEGGVVYVNGVDLAQTDSRDPCTAADADQKCKLVIENDGTRAYPIMVTLVDGLARNFPPSVVPDGHVFLLGDNRDNSHDSRTFGPVAVDDIEGTAVFIYSSSSPTGGIRCSRVGRRID